MTKKKRIAKAERALVNATLRWERYWFCRSLGDTYEYACKAGEMASRLAALRKGMTVDEYGSKRRRWDP